MPPPRLRLAVLLAAGLAVARAAPVKVWVALADKGPGLRPPASAAPAQARRAYEDRPVYAPYREALSRAGLAVDVSLKWQNRVSGRIEPGRLPALRALHFVAAVEPMPRRARRPPLPRPPFAFRPLAKRSAGPDFGASSALFDSLGISRLHRWMRAAGLEPGRGVRVAVVDADFHLGSPIFSGLRPRIRDQWDFAENRPGAVDDLLLDSHGGQCLSLIGGNSPGTLVGAAAGADFLLYRAEVDASELYAEEDYVAASIERAVDSGAQVISISLGYRYDFDQGEADIPFAQLDGRTRPASLAVLGAARRNVLVSASMGNEASSHPGVPSLGTPADADSMLSVGIADRQRRRCSYSSTGPAADGRIKPEVVSLGLVSCAVFVAATDSAAAAIANYSGTSFAAPVAAAAAALLRQLRPEATAEDVRQALMRTASHASRPDSETGYGVMDVAAAARRLGVPIEAEWAVGGNGRVFHPGGMAPIFLRWDPGRPRPEIELIDLSGRLIPSAVSLEGAVLALRPQRPVPAGVYLTRFP